MRSPRGTLAAKDRPFTAGVACRAVRSSCARCNSHAIGTLLAGGPVRAPFAERHVMRSVGHEGPLNG